MLLALDTSGPFCSAALRSEGGVIVEKSDEIGRGHAEHLMPMLDTLLNDQGISWQDISQIACTTGPGSFTGLRVGLATARGLALALKCDCSGVTVFDAFAHGREKPLAVVIDAKRNEVWMQTFGSTISTPVAVDIEQAVDSIPSEVTHLIGSAAPMLAGMRENLVVLDENPSPPIAAVAEIAANRDQTGKNYDSAPKPLYLRQPDAKPQNTMGIAS